MIILEILITHPGIVIRAAHAIVADFAVGSHAGSHISLSIVMECLCEVIRRSTHIPEMNEEDLVLLSEMADDIGQVVSHQGEIALTESDSVRGTRDEIYELLVILYTAHDASNPSNRRQRGIIRMHGQFDVGLFRNWQNALQKVFEAIPLLFLRNDTMLSQGRVDHVPVVVAGYESPAS